MPSQTNSNQTPSPFEITTTSKSKKGGNKGIIIAVLVGVFLILGVVAGVLLVRQNQNIQEKATTGEVCGAGFAISSHGHECKKNCSVTGGASLGTEGYWINVTYGDNCGTGSDGTPKEWCDYDVCTRSAVAAVVSPTAVATATSAPTTTPTIVPTSTPTIVPTATSLASTPTPTPTATPTATAVTNPAATLIAGTSSPTATPTSTSIASVQTTARPVPVTGTDWPTILGAGIGVVVIIGSILLAI